jgi:galactokinase/mevalonate kinase-like predicted kinase
MGQIDVESQREQIRGTQDRLAEAIEELAYAKAHLKDEVVHVAAVKANDLLDKAEEKKDQIVAKLVSKMPGPKTVKAAAGSAAATVEEKASEAGEAVAEKAFEARDAVAEMASEAKETVVEKAWDLRREIAESTGHDESKGGT